MSYSGSTFRRHGKPKICLTPLTLTFGFLIMLNFLNLCQVSAADTKFLVHPKNREDKKETDATDKAIKELLGSNVYSYVSPYKGLSFWLAPMTPDQKSKISKLSGVQSVDEDKDVLVDEAAVPVQPASTYELTPLDLQKRVAGPDRQKDAPDDLKLVSWAENKKFKDLKDYAYDDAAGKDTYVYLIENGINAHRPDLKDMPNPPEWLYGPDTPHSETDDSVDGHGTCMASKVAGKNYGVAKKTHLIVLKASGRTADTEWVLEKARDDILDKKRQKKAVVLFARGARISYSPGDEKKAPWPRVRAAMEDMFENDIVVVTSSGNLGELPGHHDADLLPKIWAGDDFPLIVAGAVDNEGKVAIKKGESHTFSQGGPHVAVWAPGFEVVCADSKSDGHRLDTGTSPASAMTAGLVAYFLSVDHPPFEVGDGKTAKNARTFLKDHASWVRPDGHDKVIWNLIDSTQTDSAPQQKPSQQPQQPQQPPKCQRSGGYVELKSCVAKCPGGKCEAITAGYIPQSYYYCQCP